MQAKTTENNSSSSGGIGCLGLTQVVLITLKLTGLADITWAQVFIPVYIGAVIVIGILGLALILALLDK